MLFLIISFFLFLYFRFCLLTILLLFVLFLNISDLLRPSQNSFRQNHAANSPQGRGRPAGRFGRHHHPVRPVRCWGDYREPQEHQKVVVQFGNCFFSFGSIFVVAFIKSFLLKKARFSYITVTSNKYFPYSYIFVIKCKVHFIATARSYFKHHKKSACRLHGSCFFSFNIFILVKNLNFILLNKCRHFLYYRVIMKVEIHQKEKTLINLC